MRSGARGNVSGCLRDPRRRDRLESVKLFLGPLAERPYLRLRRLLVVALLGFGIAACNGGSPSDEGPSSGGSSGDGSGGASDGAGGQTSGGTVSTGGGTANTGGAQGGDTGGSDGTGGDPGGSGGGSTFDDYPDWVLSCALARGAAGCGNCLDSKCVFCTYATPQEREEYNASQDEADQCGAPNAVVCTACQSTVTGCPACAQE